MTRRILLPVGSRANWSSAKPLAQAIQADPRLELVLLAFGSTPSDLHGNTLERMRAEGFEPARVIPTHLDAAPMPATAGLSLTMLTPAFAELRPDVVFVIGDRHEMLGPAIAAYQTGVTLAHSMGGEVSGTVDDRTRDAITQMADVHFVATVGAAARLERMGASRVHVTGCPRIDLVRETLEPVYGVQPTCEPVGIMVSLHPDTWMSAEENYEMAKAVLEAAKWAHAGIMTHYFWPNTDAHGDAIRQAARDLDVESWAETHRKMSPEDYTVMMSRAWCLVGNSSSGVREGAWIGTPVVDVGDRQRGREVAQNVMRVHADREAIERAIAKQLRHQGRRYKRSELYGDGKACGRIVGVLADG